jgi:uncharacterized protein
MLVTTDPSHASARTRPLCVAAATGALLLLQACAAPQPVRTAPPADRAPAPTPPPVSETLPLPDDVMARLQQRDGPVALLLPLTGSFAGPAAAVRDGFLARHFARREVQEVRIYDVGDSPERLLRAYQRALDEGAAFVVGPLMKEGAMQLATLAPPVPVLTLNYLDAGSFVPPNFYQLGLAPEDEARAAADDAASHNLRNAVALVPEGDWGSRVLAAFEARVQQWGGRVVAAARYRQGVSDQSEVIGQLMGVAASQERHRALTNALGVRTEFDARRRADIDYVFIGARASDARVLLPQFRFHRATGLPHYATALVYDGRPDGELAGLRFCDMPFMLAADGDLASERGLASSLPTVGSFPRLYALGRDAYGVAAALQRGQLRVGDAVEGASGYLEWGGGGVLARRVDCAEMHAERVVPSLRSF